MPKDFKPNTTLTVKGIKFNDPRVVMRVLIGVLLAGNLVMAVLAFRPLGGSADDLRGQVGKLQNQLMALRAQVLKSHQTIDKVSTARSQSDQFLNKYFLNRRTAFSELMDELVKMADQSGIKLLPTGNQLEEVDGSDTMNRVSMQVGCEGSYQNLTKFVNLLDKSPRMLIIESMHASPQQNGQVLSVMFHIDTFSKEDADEAGD